MGLALFWGHGLGKLMSYPERAAKFADPIGIGSEATLAFAVFAEALCALAVASGIFTRLAAIPPMIFMAAAILFVHMGDPFRDWEKALLFFAGYLAIAILGPGKASLDSKFRGVS